MKSNNPVKSNALSSFTEFRNHLAELKTLEAARSRKKESILKVIFNNSPVGVFILYNGELKLVNPQFFKITGYTKEELADDILLVFHPDDRGNVSGKTSEMQSGEISSPFEFRLVRKDGKVRWAIGTLTSVQEKNFSIVLGTIMDVTDLKKAKEKLKESEERYRRLVELSPDGIAVHSEGRIVFINPEGAKKLGAQSPQEIIGKPLLDFVHPHCHKAVIERVFQMLKTGEIAPLVEEKLIKLDGTFVDVEVAAAPMTFEGKPAVQVVAREITNHKKALEELNRLNQFLSIIIGNANVWLNVLDENANVVIWNKAAEIISGYPAEEVIGHGEIWRWLYPDEEYRKQITGKAMAIIRRGEAVEDFETTIVTKNKEKRIISWHSKNLIDQRGAVFGSVALGRDVTARKRAKESLHLYQERFAKAFNVSPNPMAITTSQARFIEVNNSFAQQTGYLPEEIYGMTPNELGIFVNPEILTAHLKKLHTHGYLRDLEVMIRVKSGELRVGTISADIIELGEEKYILAIFSDITESRQAEKALKESQDRYRYFMEHSRDAIFVVSAKKEYIDVNPAACRMLGYDRASLLQMSLMDTLAPEFNEVGRKMFNVLKNQGYVFGELSLKDREGRYISGEINATVLPDGNYLGIVRDITERKMMEKKMARLDQLNLVGQMAAAIGHEIRNPMTAVRGFLQMMRSKNYYNNEKQYFDLMIEELDRANSIISEFLSVAKNKPVALEKKNLSKIVQSLSQLITANALNSDHNIQLDLGEVPDLPLDEKEIRQLILNLVRNGLEAMSTGGILTLKTYTDRDCVILSIQDQGKGIDKDILDKIGTPFLTTKDAGTGLGLAVCYGIAARHNATVDIKTGNTGTTFFIRFKKVMPVYTNTGCRFESPI